MSKKKAVGISIPSEEDVVFEKGLKSHRNPGNTHYRKVIKEKVTEYSVAETRKLKDMIAMSIYRQLNGSRRFLTRLDDGKYYAVSEEAVIVKIKQALRDQTRDRVVNPERKSKGPTKKKERERNETSTELNPIPIKKNSNIHVHRL